MKIIADISGNHGGFLDKARELIQVAQKCGCDYAKFQYYAPRDMYDHENKSLYERFAVPRDWLDPLFHTALTCGIGLFASVFSSDGVCDIMEYAPAYFKLASPQSTWLPTSVYKEIVEEVPATTPIIFSADSRDLLRMEAIIQPHACWRLYCPPGHPPELMDADFFEFVEDGYDGFSDHTAGLLAPLAFAGAGATIIEKHLKLDDNCIDAAFSADARTMTRLCEILK